MFSYYSASLSPLADSGVTGHVKLFLPTDLPGTVCFVGAASGLEPNLASRYPEIEANTGTDCGDANGCGVHIHMGVGADACTDTTTQGGHWWNNETLSVDPWSEIGYLVSSADGRASFADCVYTGSMESVDMRAFIVHSNNGTRVACGIMEEDSERTVKTMTTSTMPLSDGGVSSEVTVMMDIFLDVPDGVCFVGTASGLEGGIDSAYAVAGTGSDCLAANGCGVHLHSGSTCDDTTTQGGHLYDVANVPIDPWLIVGYTSTDDSGNAKFADCVVTGTADIINKPVIVHANDGSRVSCGILDAEVDAETSSGVVLSHILVPSMLVAQVAWRVLVGRD